MRACSCYWVRKKGRTCKGCQRWEQDYELKKMIKEIFREQSKKRRCK